MSKSGIFVFTLAMVVTLIVVTLPDTVKANPSMEDAVNVAEALRYLEKIDKFYSNIARPRDLALYLKRNMKEITKEQENKSPGTRIRELDLRGHVGFDSLPHQLVKKRVLEGFDFNILCIGETGIGKSTLMGSLFNLSLKPSAKTHFIPEVELKTASYNLFEKGINIKLTIVETAGYGDQTNRQGNFDPIINYVDSQFDAYIKEELKIKRSLSIYHDKRIHACLYFICPTGHSLKPIDLLCMKNLHKKVNIIPIIAKSDTLSKAEQQKFKMAIRKDLEDQKVEIYKFPTDDEEISDTNTKSNDSIPFAVAASRDFVHIGNKAVRARVFPWGTMLVDNEEHSEFLILKEALIGTNMEHLREKTHTGHYENYRRDYLEKCGYTGFENKLYSLYHAHERMENEFGQEMMEEEEKLKLRFIEKIKEKELEFKEQEAQTVSKYNSLFEEIEAEAERISNLLYEIESKIILLQRENVKN